MKSHYVKLPQRPFTPERNGSQHFAPCFHPVGRYRREEQSVWCGGYPLPAFAGTSFAGMTAILYKILRTDLSGM
jgi:hypothetical protein